MYGLPRLHHSHSRTLFSSSSPVSLAHHPHALNSTGEESNAMEKSELIHFLYCSGIVFFSCCCCFIIACNRHKYIVLVSYVYIKHIKYKYIYTQFCVFESIDLISFSYYAIALCFFDQCTKVSNTIERKKSPRTTYTPDIIQIKWTLHRIIGRGGTSARIK